MSHYDLPITDLRKNKAFILILSIMSLILLTQNVYADSGDRVALLIANQDYTHGDLKNPVNDAKLIQQKLNNLNYDVTVVKNADRYKMLNAIEKFGKESKGADSAVFYYSGHGMQDDYKQNFLLPVDARISNESSIRAYGVEAYEIINALKKAKPRISLVIFDACRDNPFAGVRGSRNFSVESYQTDSELLVSYATQTGQYAEDGNGRNSPYAIALAKQLEQADTVPLLKMFDNVKNDVRQQTNNKQSPTKMGDAEYDTYLVASSGAGVGVGSRLYMQHQAEQLENQMSGTAVKVNHNKVDNEITVNIPSNLLFNSRQSYTVSSSNKVLNSLSLLKQYDKTQIKVTAHTDSEGGSLDNQILTEKRAYFVASYLNKNGIEANRLSTVGYG